MGPLRPTLGGYSFSRSAAVRFQNHQAAAAEDGNFVWQGAETDDRASNVGAGSMVLIKSPMR
jgi:hypothetical protein